MGVVGVATLAVWSSAGASKGRDAELLGFDTMIGNPRPYTGAAGAVRGLNASPGSQRP